MCIEANAMAATSEKMSFILEVDSQGDRRQGSQIHLLDSALELNVRVRGNFNLKDYWLVVTQSF